MPAVKLNEVSIKFGTHLVLDKISFEVDKGKFVALLGPSGCGKTTLLNIIADILQPTGGEVRVNDESPQTARRKREIGYVFQNLALLKNRTVLRNVQLPLEINGWPKDKAEQRVREILRLVRLEGFENHLPFQLSGGMKQRVAIARVFACDYRILLMDEPFGALDAYTRKKMGDELLRVWQQNITGPLKTIIFVTHDEIEAVYLSDMVIFLGGSPGIVKAKIEIPFSRPRSPNLRTDEKFLRITARLWQLYQEEEKDDN